MSLKNQAVSPVFAEHRADLDQLCRRYHVARLEVFGSAAVGQDEPTRSDLDFLVEFSSVPSGTYADNYFALLEGLQELFRRPVDLVSITAIKNRYFCESIERTKKLIYAA